MVEKVGTVATSGGGERGCVTVVDPEGIVEVEIVIGFVREVDEPLLVRAGVCGLRNR